MIALFLVAISSSTGAPGVPLTAVQDCATEDQCRRAENRRYRLRGEAGPTYDVKMDAYRLNPRPCKIIGDMRCPGQTREIWRMGESVRTTIGRSFGFR